VQANCANSSSGLRSLPDCLLHLARYDTQLS
jgi:hypothetical protein